MSGVCNKGHRSYRILKKRSKCVIVDAYKTSLDKQIGGDDVSGQSAR